MADSEIRDALRRRLNRNQSDDSSTSAAKLNSSGKHFPPVLEQHPNNAVYAVNQRNEVNAISQFRMEGYLSKFSSGTFGRWQKRYFVLENGKLSYYKKVPTDGLSGFGSIISTPNKVFSIRRFKSITEKESDNKEFTLLFVNGKSYSIKAPSVEETRKWVDSIKSAIAHFEQFGHNIPADEPLSDDDDFEFYEGMTSLNGSVLSDVSPKHANLPLSPNKRGDTQTRRDSVPVGWDGGAAELDVLSGIDKNFEEWFYFVTAENSSGGGSSISTSAVRMSNIIDACNRANNYLWTILAGIPRNSVDVKITDAIIKAKARICATSSAEIATLKITSVVEEYFSKLSHYVNRSLDARQNACMNQQHRLSTTIGLNDGTTDPFATVSSLNAQNTIEIPPMMDCIAKVMNYMERFLEAGSSPTTVSCVCEYCDPSGIGLLKLQRAVGGKKNFKQPPVSCLSDKWRKILRSLLQRLGGELEVTMIEDLQNVMQDCDAFWDGIVVKDNATGVSLSSTNGLNTISPRSHPLLEDFCYQAASHTCLMSTFSTAFIQSAQTKCINSPQQWMAAYPQCARLIAEHSSSALVAAINSLWRQFKRKQCSIAEIANAESVKKYTDALRSKAELALTTQSGIDRWTSFANESVLVSQFCAKTWSNGVTSKFTPDVFVTCMESLSDGFLATASDVANSIVTMHYVPRARFDLCAIFLKFGTNQKGAITASPMEHAKKMAQQLSTTLADSSHCLPCVHDRVMAVVSDCMARQYAECLVKSKPKPKQFNNFSQFLQNEIQIYLNLFSTEFPQPQVQLDESTMLFNQILNSISDPDKFNLSIYFNVFSKLIGSSAQALTIVNSVTKIREQEFTSSTDKKHINQMIAAIKQDIKIKGDVLCRTENLDQENCDPSNAHRYDAGTNNKKRPVIVLPQSQKQQWRFED